MRDSYINRCIRLEPLDVGCGAKLVLSYSTTISLSVLLLVYTTDTFGTSLN